MAKKPSTKTISKFDKPIPIEAVTFVHKRKNKDVINEQTKLKELGLYEGEIDGIVGSKTRAAREKYNQMQQPKGITEVSAVDQVIREYNSETGGYDRRIRKRLIEEGKARYEEELVSEKELPQYVKDNIELFQRNKKYAPMTEEGYSFADGGIYEVGAGALGGAGTGAGLGLQFGGPVGALVGAGVGAIAGGIKSWFGKKNREDEQEEFERKQKELERKARISSDSAQFSQYANAGQGTGDEFADGGTIKRLATNVNKLEGASHEEGGIKHNGVEVEGGEVEVQKGGSSKVYSDRLGFSKEAEELASVKGALETSLIADVYKHAKYFDALTKGGSKYKVAGIRRNVDAYQEKVDKTKSEINAIDKALEKLHNAQQEVNQGHSTEDAMPTAKDNTGGRSLAVGVMKDGGIIKATDGIINHEELYNGDYNSNKIMDIINQPLDLSSINTTPGIAGAGNKLASAFSNVEGLSTSSTPSVNTGSKVGTFRKNNNQLASGLLMTAGNFFSNLSAHQAAKSVKVPEPKLAKAYTREARVDVSGQKKAVSDAESRFSDYVERNVSNPALARQLMSNQSIKSGSTMAQIESAKENAESTIRGQNLQNIQNVDNANIAKLEQHEVEKYNKTMDDIGRQSQISASAFNDLKQTIMNQGAANFQNKQLALEALKGVDDIMLNDMMPLINDSMTISEYTNQLKQQGLDENAIQERINKSITLRKFFNLPQLKQ